MKNTEPQRDALEVYGPQLNAPARGKSEAVSLVCAGKTGERILCRTCGRTSGALAGLRIPDEQIAMRLFAYGCLEQGIVQAWQLDERTVALRQQRTETRGQEGHEEEKPSGHADSGDA